MYYNQSPGLKQLQQQQNQFGHPDWTRAAQHPQQQQPGGHSNGPGGPGGGPTSPAYTLYTNAGMHLQQPGGHPFQSSLQHPQHSLSQYASPPNGHMVHQASPGVPTAEPMSQHWQQQLLKCEAVRQSRSPHHRARASAMASRNVAAKAVPITNPNAVPILKPPEAVPATNGTSKEKEVEVTTPAAGVASAVTSPNTPSIAADHPSATVAPEVQRPTAPKPIEASWNALDMGGVQIKHLPSTSGIFSYRFLTTLYLNHNRLQTIPPAISKLRHLELLDLSGNEISSLPVELGMLSDLKELYLFDNQLSRLPHELGTLHQLQTLGIEGNPLDPMQLTLVQKEGTPALISHLRDHCPIPDPPPDRHWVNLVSATEREAMAADPTIETFSVFSYNILCERAATEKLYGYTASWALKWDFRKEVILNEIRTQNADFVCLQEVDIGQYEDYFQPMLFQEGADYDGVYCPKGRWKTMGEAQATQRRLVDGCAVFYKRSKYTLVEQHILEFKSAVIHIEHLRKSDDTFNRVHNRDHIAVICCFESKESGSRFIVANTHLFWDAAYSDVKLVQTGLLIEKLQEVSDTFASYPVRRTEPGARPPPSYSDGSRIPLVLCGDFNSMHGSGVYEFLSNGYVSPSHPDWLNRRYGLFTEEGMRHRLGLKNSYANVELGMTNYTPGFQGVLDYIWYGGQNLALNAVLAEVDKGYLEKVIGFPNSAFPSDHICLAAEFRVKPPRDTQRSFDA